MRRIKIFYWMALIVLVSCRPNVTKTAGGPTQADTVQIPAEDITVTLAVLPSNPNIQSSQIVLRAFFETYNRHDLVGVLATLAETFAYGDCDFAERHMLVFEKERDLATWLQARFADEEQFQVIEMIIAPPEGSPPNDPRLAAVKVFRTSKTLKVLNTERESFFKVVLSVEGNRIQYLNTYGNVDCESGR